MEPEKKVIELSTEDWQRINELRKEIDSCEKERISILQKYFNDKIAVVFNAPQSAIAKRAMCLNITYHFSMDGEYLGYCDHDLRQ